MPAESGSLTVTKRVVGDAASVVPAGTAFTVAYAIDGAAGELTVPVGGSATLDDLPVGAEVVLGEPGFPAVEGVEWGEPTWQVDGGAVEPGDDGTVRLEVAVAADVAVTLTNTADRPLEPTPAPTPTTPTTPTVPTDPTVPTTPDVPGTPDAPGAPADGGTGGLATTGVQAAGVAIAALLLVALGTGVLVLRRRRGA
nr:DUF5979 domain-containing protein [Cellulosimicrobium sp. MM]